MKRKNIPDLLGAMPVKVSVKDGKNDGKVETGSIWRASARKGGK